MKMLESGEWQKYRYRDLARLTRYGISGFVLPVPCAKKIEVINALLESCLEAIQ